MRQGSHWETHNNQVLIYEWLDIPSLCQSKRWGMWTRSHIIVGCDRKNTWYNARCIWEYWGGVLEVHACIWKPVKIGRLNVKYCNASTSLWYKDGCEKEESMVPSFDDGQLDSCMDSILHPFWWENSSMYFRERGTYLLKIVWPSC